MNKNEKNCVRRALIPINPFIFLEVLLGQTKIVFDKKMPEDINFITAFYNYEKNCFYILVESKEFDCIESGKTLPILDFAFISEYSLDYFAKKIKDWIKKYKPWAYRYIESHIELAKANLDLKNLGKTLEVIGKTKKYDGDLETIKKDIGETFVSLVILCELLDLKIEECVFQAYKKLEE